MKKSIYLFLVFCSIFFFGKTEAQDYTRLMKGAWVVTQGWFTDSSTMMINKETAILSRGVYNVFHFQDDNSVFQTRYHVNVDQEAINPISIYQGNWSVNKKILTVHMKGRRLSETFDFTIKYKIETVNLYTIRLKKFEVVNFDRGPQKTRT